MEISLVIIKKPSTKNGCYLFDNKEIIVPLKSSIFKIPKEKKVSVSSFGFCTGNRKVMSYDLK